MGSEHYCLRWNNHQSNLLGVFSQLLQDESLVDVTLACSEGASIRAHKVVLSACSSYFQALFLDHPSRHPIVILKDVRYPELRTLIEFMYKGEVNVQYCQLSALLKTAESLKVKGLAEMTNQSTAYHEPEREHERLRPHSVTSKNNNNETLETSAATTTTSSSIRATPTSTLTSNSRLEADRNNSPISPTRLHNPHSPTTPLALYQRKLNRDHHLHHHNISETQISPSSNNNNNNNNNDFGGKGPSGSGEQQLFGCVSGNNKDDRPSSPDDDAMSNDVGERLSKFTMQHKFLYSKENLGLNMSLNPNSLHPSLTVGAVPSSLVGLPPPISISSHPSDLRPLSRGGSGLSGSSSVPSMMNSSREMVASGSGLPSPMSEPIAGPSGMGPVQQVPLSLKKEIEWDRHEDKLIGGEGSSSEFRHPHDAIDESLLSNYRNSLSGNLNRSPLPFAFPFAPLSLGLFDTDPSRILGFLHHQTLLAEEALRYRGIFLSQKDPLRYNPLAELLSKEQDRLFKRTSTTPTMRDHFKYPLGIPDLLPATTLTSSSKTAHHRDLSDNTNDNTEIFNLEESIRNHNRSETPHRMLNHPDTYRTPHTSRDILDEILFKRGGGYLKDSIRFNPLATSMAIAEHQHHLKEKLLQNTASTSSSSMSSTSASPSSRAISETSSVLLQEGSNNNDEDTKCNLCNAVFPTTWLLEQHTNLQHSAGTAEEKSYLCDQYRSAYAKHNDQNHRARLPADKLFTCDVCGMQFRYLKSFKKHRLNHALERIHGKKTGENGIELVSSSNEALEENIDLNGMIKDEDEEDDPNEIIDSAMHSNEQSEYEMESNPKITSTDMEISSHSGNIGGGGRGLISNEIGGIKVRSQLFLQKSEAEISSLLPTTSTINNLLRPDTTIGLNPQEASLFNFLRVDAAEKQQRTAPVSRFACPFCGKCVRSKENLKLHVRKHTGERPFVCLFCGRAFGGKSDLTRHLRIHTGERPYHCEACGKCFARADYLSKHLTTHLHNTSR